VASTRKCKLAPPGRRRFAFSAAERGGKWPREESEQPANGRFF
jgi:hypothetical protein